MRSRLLGVMFFTASLSIDSAIPTAQVVAQARLNLRVVAPEGSAFDVAGYLRDRLQSVRIDVLDRCDSCDATLSVDYRERRGTSFPNGAMATGVESSFLLTSPQGQNLWSARVLVRPPDLVQVGATSELLRQEAIDRFKQDLFSHYLGEWVLVKLGRLEELTVLERAVTNTAPYTGASYQPAKQALPILRSSGAKGGNALLAALSHPNWDIRADAASALADIGHTSALGRLEQLSRDDKEGLVRKAASDAVARLRSRLP
jgi:hypothetical protein